jgi:hypothetical protein
VLSERRANDLPQEFRTIHSTLSSRDADGADEFGLGQKADGLREADIGHDD